MNVKIAGISVGRNYPGPDSHEKLQRAIIAYQFAITYPDGNTKVFRLTDTGITPNINASIASAIAAQSSSSLWEKWQFWHTKRLSLVTDEDENKVNNFMAENATVVKKPVTNASISIAEGKVTLNPATNGTGFSIDGGKDRLLQKLANLQTEPIRLKFMRLPPVVKSASLQHIKNQAETIIARSYVFVIYGKEIKASPEDVGSWLDVKTNDKNQTAQLEINGNKVLSYVSRISKPYASSARSQVIFTLSDGKKISLSPSFGELNGDNKDSVSNDLAKQIANGNVRTVLSINYTSGVNLNYSYDKWLAVDLTAKRMYAYEKTVLVRTFLVSAGAPSTPTTPGFHKIYSKVRVQDMRGPNADGSTYFQPNVEYVNYFRGGEAIHGNYWRPLSYFGNINSSHGCVGIVNSDAAWVYNWAPIGTPVITYN